MNKTNIYNQQGKVIEEITLDRNLFVEKINTDLIYLAVNAHLANKRGPYAHSKIRSEIRGGGAKPWRQKGTGHARAGSSRSPLWVGGGVTFGPRKERNFSQKINHKANKKALLMALGDKYSAKKIILVNKLKLSEIKTKKAEEILQTLPIEEGSILIVISEKNANIQKSFRNIPYVKVITANTVNILDILKYDYLVLEKPALAELYKIHLKKELEIKPIKTVAKPKIENSKKIKNADKSNKIVKKTKKIK